MANVTKKKIGMAERRTYPAAPVTMAFFPERRPMIDLFLKKGDIGSDRRASDDSSIRNCSWVSVPGRVLISVRFLSVRNGSGDALPCLCVRKVKQCSGR